MRPLFALGLLVPLNRIMAQTVAPQKPIEEQHAIGYGWWLLGVLLAIGVGIVLYMLIKKDPRRDAVR